MWAEIAVERFWKTTIGKMENGALQTRKMRATHLNGQTDLCFKRMNGIAKAHPMNEMLKLISNIGSGFLHINWSRLFN